MKNKQIMPINYREKILETADNPVPRLSDNAFYLIALSSILKKMIRPASMQQFLTSGNNIKINDGAGG